MANPQLENGYTQIPNELLEAFAKIRIPGEARQVLDVIFRKIYGFRKHEDSISLSQFCLATGLIKPRICEAIKKLEVMNLITVKRNDGPTMYRFIKDFDKWEPLRKNVIVTEKRNQHYGKAEKSLRKSVHTKEKKKTITKEIPPQVFDLAGLLADHILKNNPKHSKLANGKYQECVQSWAPDIEKLHRLNKQGFEDIRAVIVWCQSDKFWKKNILSGEALRKGWDRLVLEGGVNLKSADSEVNGYGDNIQEQTKRLKEQHEREQGNG